MRVFGLPIAVLLLVATSAGAKEKNLPSSVVIEAPIERVKSVVSARFALNGWHLDSDGQFQQVWAKNMDGLRGALINLVGTPRACYAIHPRSLVTFNFVPDEKGKTLVVETEQLETATALCQKTVQEIDGKKERAASTAVLAQLKAECEKFPTGAPVSADPMPRAEASPNPAAQAAPPAAAPTPAAAPAPQAPLTAAPDAQALPKQAPIATPNAPSPEVSVAEAARRNREAKAKAAAEKKAKENPPQQ